MKETYQDILGMVALPPPDQETKRQAISLWLCDQYDLLPGFGWLDGGCFALALAYRALGAKHGTAVYVHAYTRENGQPDHFLARRANSRHYFDGDGFASRAEVTWKMRHVEQVNGTLISVPAAMIQHILGAKSFWYSEKAVQTLCTRMDKAFGARLLAVG